MFSCGCRCFGDGDKRARNRSSNSPNLTPKNRRIFRRLLGKDLSKKNPYAELGLDKFHQLLADLEEKKQKIYNEIGVEEVSTVRFVFSGSDAEHARPVIVRVKNNTRLPTNNAAAAVAELDGESCGEVGDRPKGKGRAEEEAMKMRRRWKERVRVKGFGRSCYCVGVMVVLILAFLAMYGRPFAIVCTTIAWYLIPQIAGGKSSLSSWRNSVKC